MALKFEQYLNWSGIQEMSPGLTTTAAGTVTLVPVVEVELVVVVAVTDRATVVEILVVDILVVCVTVRLCELVMLIVDEVLMVVLV